MFFKATTPLVRDTVIVSDANDNEITRFVAVWQRPDSKARKALLQARVENLQALQAAQQVALENGAAYDMDALNNALSAIEDDSKARIRQQLNGIEGLLDDADQPVDFTPAVIDELFRWAEYTNPLTESLSRLTEGRTVENAQVKNSETPAPSGQAVPVERGL